MSIAKERHVKQDIAAAVDLQDRIFTIRGDKVILDSDLAGIYGVETKRLNEQVRRNADRFPPDFAFELTEEEADQIKRLRSQFATLKRGQHRKYPGLDRSAGTSCSTATAAPNRLQRK